MFDIGLAAQNITLIAHALGLGTVIIGLYDHDQAKAVLHIPDGFELVALMPLGYPSKVPSPPKRKEYQRIYAFKYVLIYNIGFFNFEKFIRIFHLTIIFI